MASYEIDIIKSVIAQYPEIKMLVGDMQFTPEATNLSKQSDAFGKMFFVNSSQEQIKEFDRTILSIILFHYIKDNKYDEFVKSQKEEIRLSRDSFNNIRQFFLSNIKTYEDEEFLRYFVIINDVGKNQKLAYYVDKLGIKTSNHDEVLKELIKLNKLPSIKNFSAKYIKSLLNVLECGINFGQLIRGECVDYSYKNLNNLSEYEKKLMLMESMLDISGVLGHINQNGSIIFNQLFANDFINGMNVVLNAKKADEIFNNFLKIKAKEFDLKLENKNAYLERTITRICLMLGLNKKSDIKIVENEIMRNKTIYQNFINEFNETGFNNKLAILPYYYPALLNNALNYYKNTNQNNPLQKTLQVCLPYLQEIMIEERKSILEEKNGIHTLSLRENAIIAGENPDLFIKYNEFYKKRQ